MQSLKNSVFSGPDTPVAKPAPKSVAEVKPLPRPIEANRAIKRILKRARVKELPPLGSLLRNKTGITRSVSDVAVFIGTESDAVLKWLNSIVPVKNIINGSAEVELSNVIKVGTEIVKAGKLYQIPHIAEIEETGEEQCTSGRHRLAFFALAYGPDVQIPFYMEKMTITEARDAVVYANDARTVRAQEKAEHAAMQAAGGDAEISQRELYEKMSFLKSDAQEYCVFSVITRGYPLKLSFPVSTKAGRGDSITTLPGLKGFWRNSIPWSPDMSQQEYDKGILESTSFINSLVSEMGKCAGFMPDQHMASMPLIAIGKYYKTRMDVGMPMTQLCIEKLAKSVVGLGPVARVSSDIIYKKILTKMAS